MTTSTHLTPRAEARGMLRVNTERRYSPRFKNRGLAPSNVSRKTALKELQTIPGVGPKIAENMWKLGMKSVADFRGRDPEEIYRALSEREGGPVDRCALYVMRCAVYYASHKKHDPEKLKWWQWKDKT